MIPHSRSIDPSYLSSWPEDDFDIAEVEATIDEYIVHGDTNRHILRDFFAAHFPEYCKSYHVPEDKLKIMNSLIACKTGKLGYTLTYCEQCGRIEMHAASCGNRNCPSCGYLDEQRWVAMRQAEVIPGIPYYHLVFTLPHELTALMYQNQKETLNLLFGSAKDAILAMVKDKYKVTPGILMVLHTFGSNLSLHYHIHVLVPGGGLTQDKTEFKRFPYGKYFLPVKPLCSLYRGKFMDGLKQLREDRSLNYYNDAEKYRNDYTWQELMNSCYGKEWNIEIKPLVPITSADKSSGSAENTNNAITYFARYTNRTAISESRIVSFNDQTISFRYKDYDGSSYTMKVMELANDEFIRRFLMHLLPTGFTRIRFAGFLACCVRKKNLELIASLMDYTYRESPTKAMNAVDLIRYFYGRDVTICESCHIRLEVYHRMSRRESAIFIRAA